MYRFCRKCWNVELRHGIYCIHCKQDLISASVASKLLSISVTQFNRLADQYPNELIRYPYRSQTRFSTVQVEGFEAAESKLNTIKVVKWSYFFLRCRGCKTADKPHHKNGYCEDCFKPFITWENERFKRCRICKSANNDHIIAGYCSECYKDSSYFIIIKHYKKGLNYQEIASKLNITRERVRQILKKSIESKSIEINSKKVSSLVELRVEGRKKRVKQIWMEIIDKNYDRYMNLARGYYSVDSFCQDHKIPQTAKFVFEEYYPEIFNIINSREKRWASSYDECTNCGTRSVPHKIYGYCKDCYYKSMEFKTVQKKSRLKNIDKRRAYTKTYTKLYNSRPEIKQKYYLKNDLFLYGGNREKALIRDSYKCINCGMTRDESKIKSGKDLLVRHIDNDKKNNRLENLATYCQSCFTKDVTRYYLQNTVKSRYEYYQSYFAILSDAELIDLKRKSKRNPGWVASRSYYETALTEELQCRGLQLPE